MVSLKDEYLILPNVAISQVVQKEFNNFSFLKKRLSGERTSEICFSLRLPSQKFVQEKIGEKQFILRYQEFCNKWNNFSHQEIIRRECRKFSGLDGASELPAELIIKNLFELSYILNEEQKSFLELAHIRSERLAKVVNVDQSELFYPWLELYLGTPGKFGEKPQISFSDREFEDLLVLLPQLKRGLGKGIYLRAIPLVHIDTKFMEKNREIIFESLKIAGIANESDDDLESFLGVEPIPDAYVHMAILDLDLVGDTSVTGIHRWQKLPYTELRNFEPLGCNLIVAENVQTGYMLPPLKNTVAIFGGGKDLKWAQDCLWIKNKQKIAYWGDIDASGFFILGLFRKLTGLMIPSLMMDLETLQKHKERMCIADDMNERKIVDFDYLTGDEIMAFNYLYNNSTDKCRLEQEKIDQNYLLEKIKDFFESE